MRISSLLVCSNKGESKHYTVISEWFSLGKYWETYMTVSVPTGHKHLVKKPGLMLPKNRLRKFKVHRLTSSGLLKKKYERKNPTTRKKIRCKSTLPPPRYIKTCCDLNKVTSHFPWLVFDRSIVSNSKFVFCLPSQCWVMYVVNADKCIIWVSTFFAV